MYNLEYIYHIDHWLIINVHHTFHHFALRIIPKLIPNKEYQLSLFSLSTTFNAIRNESLFLSKVMIANQTPQCCPFK